MRQTNQNRIQSFAFVISVWFAVCFSLSVMASLRAVESSVVRSPSRLQNRINPNEAPVESLVRLPGLGAGRAGAIVAYRENFKKKNGKGLAFEDCNDLLKVSGIGPKTVQSICEWLTFD
jgi:competence ComEA-like helix-hairpin-helix protein